MKTKRGTASKRLSLDLFLVNDYLKLFRERGSYFFAFLSMIIRSNLTTRLNKDMIDVKQVNTIMTTSYAVIRHHHCRKRNILLSSLMTTSYAVIRHHLRSLIIEACEGMRRFVMTTKDNHLPYTAVPYLIYIIENYRQE